MTLEATRRPAPTEGTTPALVRVGAALAVIGLVGIVWWGVRAWFDTAAGVASDYQVCDLVGVPDPAGEPETWVCLAGPEDRPRVMYTGSHMAIMELDERAGRLHQADLRMRWLYPSAGLLVVGLGAVAYGYRRELDAVGNSWSE